MKKIISGILLGFTINAFALEAEPMQTLGYGSSFVPAERESLPQIQSNNPDEVVFTTSNIPENLPVLVSCSVELSSRYYDKSQFVFYVKPGAGQWGSVEERIYYSNGNAIIQNVGHKVYTNHHLYNDRKISRFHITQVKRNNESIIININKLPRATKVTCDF